MELQQIREWQEKDGKKLLPTIRLYISRLHLATVWPDDEDPSLYHWDVMHGYEFINIGASKQPLEDIKMQIELSIKEFFSRVSKPRKLVKLESKPQ